MLQEMTRSGVSEPIRTLPAQKRFRCDDETNEKRCVRTAQTGRDPDEQHPGFVSTDDTESADGTAPRYVPPLLGAVTHIYMSRSMLHVPAGGPLICRIWSWSSGFTGKQPVCHRRRSRRLAFFFLRPEIQMEEPSVSAPPEPTAHPGLPHVFAKALSQSH